MGGRQSLRGEGGAAIGGDKAGCAQLFFDGLFKDLKLDLAHTKTLFDCYPELLGISAQRIQTLQDFGGDPGVNARVAGYVPPIYHKQTEPPRTSASTRGGPRVA
jgi:hypothetical protein